MPRIMRLSRLSVGLTRGALALCALACSPKGADRPCPGLPCSAQASLRAALTPESAPLGEHTFALDVDGVASTCKVNFTSLTSLAHGECTINANVYVGPVMRGKDTKLGDTVMHTEEPVPGQFEWSLTVYGQPKQVRVIHTVAGRTIADHTAKLTYHEHRPNGAGCEPVCQQASETWGAGSGK